jgi:hypothetical protein
LEKDIEKFHEHSRQFWHGELMRNPSYIDKDGAANNLLKAITGINPKASKEKSRKNSRCT